MDVLNTTGGEFSVSALVLALIFIVLGIALIAIAIITDEIWATAVGSALLVGGIIVLTYVTPPIRHEVTLRPGHVIDAAKYEVVEQRGKIFVIEEREEGE